MEGRTTALEELGASLAVGLGAAEAGLDGCGLWARFAVDACSYPMRFIPAGAFLMGASHAPGPNHDPDAGEEEGPVHQVTLTQGFWLGWHPVTVLQYRAFCEATGQEEPEAFGAEGFDADDLPVTYVSFYDALAFCRWLSQRLGMAVSLPTEAQWEYAARDTDGRRYPWGNEPPDCTRAYFHPEDSEEQSPDGPAAIGERPAGKSPFGVEDMAGNVWEWCNSVYRDYEEGEQIDGCHPDDTDGHPDDPSDEAPPVVRGGSWFDSSGDLRCSFRDWYHPRYRNDDLGFRVVLRPGLTG